jgi:hypothetical protein
MFRTVLINPDALGAPAGASMLTELAIKNAKPRDKDYKLADAEGLHLYVTKTGHRSLRLKYRFAGKEPG